MASSRARERSRSPGPESDEALFERFRRGDSTAFDALALRFKDRAYWIAFNMIRDGEESLDMVQEALTRVFTAAASFDAGQKFSTWFFRILVNLCIDHIRKRKTRRTLTAAEPPPEAAAHDPGPADETLARETRRKVREVLASLPEHHRAILVLRDIQGLSCLDIADVLDCTHPTARWRLHRARARFKESWEARFGPWEE